MFGRYTIDVPATLESSLWPTQTIKVLVGIMKLFDDIESESGAEKVQRPLSKFAFVNGYNVWQDTSYIRRKCESWFEHIPAEKRADLRNSFRSSDDSQHDGAFFELFLHELLLRLGCEVEIPTNVGGLTPDFRVSQKGISIYVEATAVGPKSNPFYRSRNEQDVIDKLNTLSSPYFSLWVDMEGTLQRTLSQKHLTRKVKRLLNAHDPDEVRGLIANFGRDAAPSEKIECGGWTLMVWLVPTPEDTRSTNSERPIVTGPYHAKMIDPISSVRDALEVKAKKYSKLDAPLVIALNACNPFYSPQECDMDVLWGNLCIQYEMGTKDRTQYLRQPNGFWSSKSSGNTSGVLSFQKVDILNVFQASACLHVNPGDCSTALPDALFRLPHCVISKGIMDRREGEDLAQLLGLSLK